MKRLKELLSPKSSSGSFLASVLVHVLVYGALVAWLNLGGHKVEEKQEDFIDLDYQTFDRPPDPEQKEQKVAHSKEPEAPQDTKTQPDNKPHEMQDEKSDVAGTQTAKKEAPAVGNESNGTAANTPYYKIKPKYPRAARLSGTEGWVQVQFDVNEEGGVENIRIIGGEQRNMFESETKRAVAEWKYKPFLDSQGKPARKKDMEARVEFKLNGEETEAGS